MVNNTLVTLRVEGVLECTRKRVSREFRRCMKSWNPEVEEMFDSLVTRNKIFFEHQKPLMINCFNCTSCWLGSVVCPKHPTQFQHRLFPCVHLLQNENHTQCSWPDVTSQREWLSELGILHKRSEVQTQFTVRKSLRRWLAQSGTSKG